MAYQDLVLSRAGRPALFNRGEDPADAGLELDVDAASTAVEKLAAGLDIGVVAAAQAVIDINASQPERERVSLTSDLNMIMSEVMLESPFGTKGAFYIAGRRSYADLIIPHVVDIPELTQIPRFWDYQAGFDYDLSLRTLASRTRPRISEMVRFTKYFDALSAKASSLARSTQSVSDKERR